MMKQSSIKARQMICDKCENTFLYSPVDIKTTNIKIDNQDLLLQCFVCPECDALYPILLIRINDMHYLKDVQESLAAYRSSFNANSQGLDKKLELINKAEEKYKDSRKKLSSAILETRKRLSGYFTYDKQTQKIYYHEKNMEEKEK